MHLSFSAFVLRDFGPARSYAHMRQSRAVHVRTVDDDSDIMIYKFESVILSLSYFFPPVWTCCQDFWKRQKQKNPKSWAVHKRYYFILKGNWQRKYNKFVPHLYFSVPLPPRAANSIIAFPPFFWHFPWQYLSGDLTKNLRSNITVLCAGRKCHSKSRK